MSSSFRLRLAQQAQLSSSASSMSAFESAELVDFLESRSATGTVSNQSFSAYRRARITAAAARDHEVVVGLLTALAQKVDNLSERMTKLEMVQPSTTSLLPSQQPGLELDELVEDALSAIFSEIDINTAAPAVTGIARPALYLKPA